MNSLKVLFILLFCLWQPVGVKAKFNFTWFKYLNPHILPSDIEPRPEGEECWNSNTSTIHYFGTRNESEDGRPCLRWVDLTKAMRKRFDGFWLYFFADEYTGHNFCRNIRLDQFRPYRPMTNATKPLWWWFSEEWKYGPFCYVKSQPPEFWQEYHLTTTDGVSTFEKGPIPSSEPIEFEPAHCFRQCGDPVRNTTTTTTTVTMPANGTLMNNEMTTQEEPPSQMDEI